MTLDILPHEKQIVEYRETIEKFKKQNQKSPLFSSEIETLERKLQQLKEKVYSELTPWERVTIARHPARPHSIHYVENICDTFHELSGDRLYADDRALIGGFARIGGQRCMLIGQERGHDTESRMKSNFGMLNPEGFRKAKRLMKLAEKLGIPVVSLLDTPGAFAGLEAEQRGQGWAIAENLKEMAVLKTPIVVVLIGEAYSGGALGTGMGDRIGMLEHACYSVISPEGCASILWKDASNNQAAAGALRLNAEDLLEHGIIDEKIAEPLGGAHHEPAVVYTRVKDFIVKSCLELQGLTEVALLNRRYDKFRCMGQVAADT